MSTTSWLEPPTYKNNSKRSTVNQSTATADMSGARADTTINIINDARADVQTAEEAVPLLKIVASSPDSNNSNDSSAITSKPPLARLEMMDEEDENEEDDREVVTKPYPGVDDGFFANGNRNNPPKDANNDPDVETVPAEHPEHDVPPLGPRFGGDGDNDNGDNHPDEPDGTNHRRRGSFPGGGKAFPHSPGFGPDLEVGGSVPRIDGSIPDINFYQNKKTLAQGMMDLALLSANANQLRYVLESYERHPYFYPSLALVSISLILQVAVGVGLIWNTRYNVKDDKEICIANKINNFTIIGIFLVTVINVFISAFGVANITPIPANP